MSRPDLRSLFPAELFLPEIEAADREQLFALLVEEMWRHGVVQHREAVLQGLLQREALGTTALGQEAAVPHCRSMVAGRTAAVFARLAGGVDFAAPDGLPVRLVFLIVAPYGAGGAAYFPLLAAIAAAVRDEATRRRLSQVERYEDLMEIIEGSVEPRLAEARSR